MSDNMEHIADFFKESGYRDRHFEVDQAGWDRLASALDQKKRRRWLPFWWSFAIVLLAGAGLWVILSEPSEVSLVTQEETVIDAAMVATHSTAQELESDPAEVQTEQKAEVGTPANQPTGTTQETHSKIAVASPATITQPLAVTNITEPDLTTANLNNVTTVVSTPEAANTKALFDQEEEETLKVQEEPAELTRTPVISPTPALPSIAAESGQESTVQSTTSRSVVSTSGHQKRSNRKPYPRSAPAKPTKSPMTTMQTMLGAPVYGSTILGEEINAWERERISGRWQAAFGVGTIPASYQGVLLYYSTEEIVDAFKGSVTLSDGNVLDIYTDGTTSARGKVAQNFNFYRFAVYRDLGKGFGIKGSLLIATIDDKTPRRLINQIPSRPDVVYFTNNSRSTNLLAELGLQYTFLRRQRFQPYIGLSVFNVIVNTYRNELRFVWPSMGIDEVSTATSTTSSTNFPGYYFEFGMQYLPAPNWSVGPSFIITGTPFVEPQFGLGLEVRYRW